MPANAHTAPKVEEKKGHVCPPSNAAHPKDRWETAFVYTYICKFTQLKSKVDGFNSVMELEDALLTPEGQTNNLLQEILTRFILILRPQSRNTGPKQLMSTLSNLLSDFFRTSERSVFWDCDKRMNIDPLENLKSGFWDASWDLKLKILRQLVELQLTHSSQIKELLDRAWGVKAMQHRKKEAEAAPLPADDPYSQKSLMQEPIGQDSSRRRYWALDSSPRLYMSTNPWKVTQSFSALASTRDEYLQTVERLKAEGPNSSSSGTKGKRTRLELNHLQLIKDLEARLETIDAELARIERARKKAEQRNMLLAQAEIRGPRTRRQTHRPDYTDTGNISDGDDQDEYKYEDDERFDEYEEMWSGEDHYPSRRSSRRNGGVVELRRSTRQTNGKRKLEYENILEERRERRSRRLGGPGESDLDQSQACKRSGTVESSEADSLTATSSHQGIPPMQRANGAAALKATEIAVETIEGKKKNKFWYYAVEPMPGESSGAKSELIGIPLDRVGPSFKSNNTRRVPSSTPSASEHSDSITLEASAPMSLDSEME